MPWIISGILLVIVIILLIKIKVLQKSMTEIYTGLEACLSRDTNVKIAISSGDAHARKLAAEINKHLKVLRKQQNLYKSGDRELKEAVTNISHDLRTPLTAIYGYLALLEKKEKSEEVTRYLSYIENRAEAMKNLTEELFQYSVILSSDEMIIEDVDVKAVLEESVAAMYAAFVERGITPDIQMTDNRIIRKANKAALSRVFGNILNNALKYSDGDLFIRLSEDGNIIFSNTAKNLDDVQVGKLFDRFFTVDNARKSTGLGLSIAQTLIRQMHGEITASYQEECLSIRVCLDR